MKKNKYIGSSFESFLGEEGILEEVHALALEAVEKRKRDRGQVVHANDLLISNHPA